MSSVTASDLQLRFSARRITVVRALLALVWAAALVIAVGDRVPTTASDVPLVAALLLTTYPLIDVVASALTSQQSGAPAGLLRANAAISAVAVVAVGAAAFGSDAAATLVAFGAWAAISGAVQLGTALVRRRTEGLQPALLFSGGLSTVAGLGFVSASGKPDAMLAMLAGYMAFGAILFLISARRGARTR